MKPSDNTVEDNDIKFAVLDILNDSAIPEDEKLSYMVPRFNGMGDRRHVKCLKALIHSLTTQAIINDYLDQCFPMSDHDDIRQGNYTGGGFISDQIILDRIKELESQL